MKVLCVLLICLVMGAAAAAQGNRQQDTFGSEMEITKPVKIPPTVIHRLKLEDEGRLNMCQHNDEFPYLRQKSLSDHFIASLMSIRNKTGGLDLLVVRSNSACFDGAHSSRFWLFFKKKSAPSTAYKMKFGVLTDLLWISDKASSTYPKIQVFYHTAVEGFTTNMRWEGRTYRAKSCYIEELGTNKKRRTKCGD